MKHLPGTLCILTLASVLLTGCGGGKSVPADVFPNAAKVFTATSGPDSFLLFPNPQKQDDGTLQINSLDYPLAYYQAVDPNNERTTLAAFKAKNRIGQSLAADEQEVSIVVGDQRDLGYGRKMTGRMNADGSIAFVVENYLAGGYGGYSSLNLDAAVVSEPKWHVGTNGIEFSVVQAGTANPANTIKGTPTVKFLKFFTFDPITGARLNMVNLDSRGEKAMPTVCISCHGGRADALTPATAPALRGLFPRIMNVGSASDRVALGTTTAAQLGGVRGDVAAQGHAFEPPALDFSTTVGFRRSDQESRIRALNKMVLCTFARPNGVAVSAPTDNCPNATYQRREANGSEYNGTAVDHLKGLYTGNDIVNGAEKVSDDYVPGDWNTQTALYQNTVAKSCRVCHSLRGSNGQSDLDFETYTKFNGYADRIKAHVLDRGNMPLAKLIYDKFWSDPTIYTPMETFLTAAGYTGTLRPGRPIADPGPDRITKLTAIPLSGAMSLYSSTYQWTIFSSAPGGATLTGATTSTPTLNVPGTGTYEVDLVTAKDGVQSTSTRLKVVVNTALGWDPAGLKFADIKAILQGGAGCSGCHAPGGQPPVSYTDIDRNADDLVDATDDIWFYTEVRSRINFTDLAASPLLRKPSGNHHGGATIYDLTANPTPGAAGREGYDKILSWILSGAPRI